MRIDEQLLQRADRPTLRFYRWDPPALSLGRFQDPADAPPLPDGADLVRRVTGGGAIFHDTGELTFALVLPLDQFRWAANPLRLYAATNKAWRQALTALGATLDPCQQTGHRDPFLCFDRRERTDLLCEGRKLLGSAQRRTAARVLIHGSLPLEPNPLARGAISLGEALGRRVCPEAVIEALLETLPGNLVPGAAACP